MTPPKDRSRDTDVIDDPMHTDPRQPDIGEPIDLSDPIRWNLDNGNLDELVEQAGQEAE